MAKVGIFSSVVGAPLGVWANRKWPDDKWKTATILLGFGLVVRYVGLVIIIIIIIIDDDDEERKQVES